VASVPSPRTLEGTPEVFRAAEELRQELGAADHIMCQLQRAMAEKDSDEEDAERGILPEETAVVETAVVETAIVERPIQESTVLAPTCEMPVASVVPWVSAPTGSKCAPRAFPSSTLFKRSDGSWVRAGQLNPEGGDELMGSGGEDVRTSGSAKLPSRDDFVRLRTMDGSIMVTADHKLLFEVGQKEGPQPSKVGKYRSYAYQLPRIFDGNAYRVIEGVETFTEMHEMVEVRFDDDEHSAVRAWTECPLGVSRDIRQHEQACKEDAFRHQHEELSSFINGTASWISMPEVEGSKAARYVPSTTLFRRPDGQWLRAVDLCKEAGNKGKLVGPGGLEVGVAGARLLQGEKLNLFYIRTKCGTLSVLDNHAILIQSGQEKPAVVKAQELKRARGPLPRIYDGEQFQLIEKVDIATSTIHVVELLLGCLPTLAFSYAGDGEPDLNPSLPIIGIKTALPYTSPVIPQSAQPSAPPSAPPSLVVVEPEAQPRKLVAAPFTDGSPRVPLSLLYQASVGPRPAGVMNTMSLQASSDLQQSKLDAAEPLV